MKRCRHKILNLQPAVVTLELHSEQFPEVRVYQWCCRCGALRTIAGRRTRWIYPDRALFPWL